MLLASAAISCHIDMPSKPVAKFSFTPENGCQAPCEVTFTSESENAIGLQWDFNDGSPLLTGNPVKHEFTAGKIYEVKLMARGVDGGTSGETRSVKIDAPAASTPEADFKYTITNDSIAPATVTFNNQSKNATTYQWDFGDTGSATNTSTEQNPVHTYLNAGSYTVTLTVKNDQNVTDTQTYTIVIKTLAPSVDAISISGGSNFTTDIIVDNSGNIFVCGEAAGTVQFSSSISKQSQPGSTDFFVAKYNSSMQCLWAVVAGSNGDDHANGLALDASGNVYVTGFLGGALVGGGTSPKGGLDGFAAKFNAQNGNREWIKTFGGPGEDQGRSIGYFNNKIYLTGFFTGNSQTSNVDFGGNALLANGMDGFLAFVDASTGDLGQPTILGGADAQRPEDMFVDTEGNAYITGGFAGSIAFPSIAPALTSAGGNDVFVAKWAANTSQFQWAKKTGSGVDEYAYDIVADASKNVYVTGMHQANLDELNLPTSAFQNVYLGQWNANGDVQKGVNGFNELKDDFHGGLAVTSDGTILIAGTYESNGRFPIATGTQLTTDGGKDIIIAAVSAGQLNPTGFAKTGGGPGDDRVNRIYAASGYVYATGWFEGNAKFNDVPLTGTSTVKNTFIVRYQL
ncbi:PKD domain-containing protein [Dyadobacter sp. SG02]|nr:PKD domain-containing protein [Dyadobacter sp. SG02]